MDPVDVISGETAASESVAVVGSAVAEPTERIRRTPLTWVARRRGSRRCSSRCRCSLIFAAFSWYPIVRLVVLSLQNTNLVDPPTWVGLRELPRRHPRPALHDGGEEHGLLRPARADLRLPDPAGRGRADQRVAPLPRRLQRRSPTSPSCIPPVRRRAALEVRLLRAEQRRALQHGARAGSTSALTAGCSRPETAMPALVVESTWANAGATVIIYLAALTAVDTRPLRRRLGGRRRDLAQDLARHAARSSAASCS